MKKIFAIIFIVVSFDLPSQNLVPNPSFETYTACPQDLNIGNPDNTKYAPPWQMATDGTPDYFNGCNTGNVGVPNNFFGFQYARTGSAYMGLYVIIQQDINAREYLTSPLISALISGENYYISMYVNLSRNHFASDRIGIYLSSSYPDTMGVYDVNLGCACRNILQIPQVENYPGNLITDTLNWVQVSGWFTALGGENYITIGNFSPDTLTTVLGNGTSYFYIDDICISTDSSVCTQQASNIKNHGTSTTINIYPNPVNSTIKISTTEQIIESKILDVLGNQLLNTTQNEIDISSFYNGTYFLQVKTNENIYKKKIIVQH